MAYKQIWKRTTKLSWGDRDRCLPRYHAVLTYPCSLSRDNYIATILKPSTWGGAIELGVLARHYGTEIASIDVETGRVDRFEPPLEMSTGNR